MGQIKFQLPDSSPKGRKRLATAKGFSTENVVAGAVGESLRKFAPSGCSYLPITRNAQYAGGGANVAITSPMFFSPMHTPQNWQIAQKRKEVYQWARFYYENEPKVAAGVDFYAQFPMNGFELECQNRAVRLYFEHMVKDLKLAYWLKLISHEYFLLGDVFPFLTIECEKCGGGGVTKSGKPCNHPDGKFKSLTILNPDFIEVEDSPIPGPKSIYMIPDDNLKRLVQRKEPRKDFDRIPPMIAQLVAGGQPIPLSPRSVSHIKHSEVGYSRYGTSLLRRLFTILGYKTKLMTANWIVAERLVLPVRVVKLGEKERPAGPEDIADMQSQLAAVANDPNLTIVTHHAFEYEWYGAEGKIHNIQGEWEQIGKEILDGLMLNQSLLNGEMQGYCLSDDTLTLTDGGFKKHYDIDPKTDKVACFNPETKQIEYHLPHEKVTYDYDGEMVHFNTDKIDILVTPNHRMWSKKRDGDRYEFVRAEDIKPRARFVGAVDGFVGEVFDVPKFDKVNFALEDYCRFAGYFASEGWTCESKSNEVGLSQTENGKAREDMAALLSRTAEQFTVSRNDFRLYDGGLRSHFRENYGENSITKRLPAFLKNLPPEYLEIVINSMLMGDGCITKRGHRRVAELSYFTSSEQLANDFAEIAFKSGYVVKISGVGNKKRARRYFNKNGVEFITRFKQYAVHISRGFKGREPVLDSKSKKYDGREITREMYRGKIYCFSVPHELFVTMRNGKVTIQGNTSAQVGVETMIRRLENWRNTLAEWVEEHIFKPTAMMQGFIDEKATKQLGRTVYLYPTIKWNDMQLRDKTNKLQLLMQLHDKQIISTEKLCEEFDIDYDQEVERIRDESMAVGPGGAMPPGGDPGAGGGAMPPGGGAPPPGADPSMMPPGGGAPGMPGAGGMPGADAGGGMPGAGLAPNASGGGLKVHKRGKAPKAQEAEPAPPPTFVKLTKIEQRIWKALQGMKLPFPVYGQYKQKVHGEQQPFRMDFAIPSVGIDIEADGKIWHEQEGAKEGDAERDRKLAAYGWRVLRFNEDAIMEQMDEVTKVIHQNISEAAEERFSKRKKASGGEGMTKYASLEYTSVKVAYVKDGVEIEWDGVNPTGIIQIVRGVTDDTIQLEVTASGGRAEEDQGPGDQLERDLPGQISVPQETL